MQAMGMEFLYPPLALGECNQYVSQRASEPARQTCEPCEACEADVQAMRGMRGRCASHASHVRQTSKACEPSTKTSF